LKKKTLISANDDTPSPYNHRPGREETPTDRLIFAPPPSTIRLK
jgi:hypothetical protein